MRARLMVGRFRAYDFIGTLGGLAGLALVTALSAQRSLAPRTWATVALTVPLSYFLAVRLSYVLAGRRRIVLYEKLLFAVAAVALFARPRAVAIDLAVIGIGCFLVFGRLGCLMNGCCHGRVAHAGIVYGPAHDLPADVIGRPLFPIQLVDAAVSLVATTAAVALWLGDARPGVPAATYLTIYGPARFLQEFFRGDTYARSHWLGVSEAQWTAVAVAWGIVVLLHIFLVPAVLLTVALAACLVAGSRKNSRKIKM